MWDAARPRSRARLPPSPSRAIAAASPSAAGRNVVGEYHYYDNRLAMAALTRLDRLAEREAGSEAQLRTLSEDLDDYIDCVASGGDADAFVEERRPPEPDPESAAELLGDAALMRLIELRRAEADEDEDEDEIAPENVEIRDLDRRSGRQDAEQWLRARQSGFIKWLAMKRGTAHDRGEPIPRGSSVRAGVEAGRRLTLAGRTVGSGLLRAKTSIRTRFSRDRKQLAQDGRGLIQQLPREYGNPLPMRPSFRGRGMTASRQPPFLNFLRADVAPAAAA